MAAVSPPNEPSGELLTVDDTMEISSDAGRHIDTDIEIDVENDGTEDEFMLEDDIHAHAVEGNDDIMLDDDNNGDTAEFPDEVLRDASVDLDPDVTIVGDKSTSQAAIALEAPTLATTGLQDPSAEPFGDHHDFALVNSTDDQTVTAVGGVVTELSTEPMVPPIVDGQIPGNSAENEFSPQAPNLLAEEPATAEDEITFDDNTTQVNDTTESTANHDDHVATTAPIEAPPTTQNHTSELHPCIVVYEETDMDLFLSAQPETEAHYLLSDKSVAHEPLPEFMAACRAVLANNIGSGEELKLRIAELGLTFHEYSTEPTACTFADLTQIYVQLSQNDGVEHPGPLYVTLTHRASFASRVDELMSAASEGKGLSDVSLDDTSNESYPDPEETELQTEVVTQNTNEETRVQPDVYPEPVTAEETAPVLGAEETSEAGNQVSNDKTTAHGVDDAPAVEDGGSGENNDVVQDQDSQETHDEHAANPNLQLSSASSTIQGDDAVDFEQTEKEQVAEEQENLLDGNDNDEIDFLDDEETFEIHDDSADQDHSSAPATIVEQNNLDDTAEEGQDDFGEDENENPPNDFQDLFDSNEATDFNAGEDENATASLDFSATDKIAESAANATDATEQGSPGVDLEDIENHNDPDVDEFIDYDDNEEGQTADEIHSTSQAAAQDTANAADFVSAANSTASLSRKRSWIEQEGGNAQDEAAADNKRSRAA